MNLQKITDAWKTAMLKLAAYGIPVPILRDPFTKKPSLPFTMMMLSIVLVTAGIVGKLSTIVGGIDMPSALQFMTTSSALYFGHSWVHKETIETGGRNPTIDTTTDDIQK